MRHEKHPLAAAAFLITSTLAAQASNLTPEEQARAFATCAGRLSALATRQSATQDPESAVTRRLESDFDMLVEATLPHVSPSGIDAAHAFDWRIAGWVEIAALLSTRHYSPDAARAGRAEADMDRRISTCRQLILPG